MKAMRWSWGYVPVIVVLGLIWYEFWRSSEMAAPQRPVTTAANTQAGATTKASPVKPPENPASNTATRVTTTRVATGSAVTAGPIIPGELHDAFLNQPPLISLQVTSASYDAVIEALRKSLGTSYIMISGTKSNPNATYNFNFNKVSFWDVFKALQAQIPMELVTASGTQEGLVLNPQGTGVYRFQTSGPAILYPMSVALSKTGTGQTNPGEQSTIRYHLNLGAAVDPRIKVLRYASVEVIQAQDDAGRTVMEPTVGNKFINQATNAWQTQLTFPVLEPRAKKVTFKCQVHFIAQTSETTVILEDATKKTGQSLTLGDRSLRLGRCEVQANQLYVQMLEDNPQIQGQPIVLTIEDANGKTINAQTQASTTRNFPLDNFVAPYRLVFRAPKNTRELTFPFEIKDVPLP